jgi:hypothetical protein
MTLTLDLQAPPLHRGGCMTSFHRLASPRVQTGSHQPGAALRFVLYALNPYSDLESKTVPTAY